MARCIVANLSEVCRGWGFQRFQPQQKYLSAHLLVLRLSLQPQHDQANGDREGSFHHRPV